MNYTILPTNDFLETVQPVIEQALKECGRVLSCPQDFKIIVQYTEDSFIIEKMGGSSGKVEDELTMIIQVNTGTPCWENSLKGSVAHEYNHLVWQQIHKKTDDITLGDLLIMEGLAQHFEEGLAGNRPAWATAISKEKAQEVWESIEKHLKEDWDEWWAKISFEDNDKYPLWSGYALAYMIIKKQIAKRGESWPELMKIKTEELLEF